MRNKIAQPIKSSGDYLKLLNKVTSGSAITDSEFGSVVNYMSQNNSKVSQISQFNILAGGGLGQNRKKDISHLAELGYNLNNNSTFVLMTMNVDSKKIMGEGGKQNLITIMPKDIIVTFILEYKSTGFMLQDFIINDMNIASRDALIDLIGIDQSAEEGDTIGKQLKENMKIIKVVLDNFAGDTRQHNFSDNTSSGTVRGYYSAS